VSCGEQLDEVTENTGRKKFWRSTVIQPTSQRWDQKKAVLFALLFGAFQDQWGFHLPYERYHQRPKAKKIAE